MKTISVILLSCLCIELSPALTEVTHFTIEEAKCLATNVYHEARGEPWKGQVAVARVTLNRGGNICEEVYRYKQFSWRLKPKLVTDTKAYYKAFLASHEALLNPLECTHYHTTKVKPKWRKKLEPCAIINKHIFYK